MDTRDKTSFGRSFINGLKAGAPVIFGFVPVAVAYALMARQSGFSAAETVLMSAAVFAGASQIMSAGMYAQGAGVLAIILAAFILNLRHLIMSTCVMNSIKGERTWMKLAAAFGVTDESFAIFTTEAPENRSAPFLLGLVCITYAAWVLGTLAGALASDLFPDVISASFGIALYSMFISILAPGLEGRPRLLALVLVTALLNFALSKLMAPSWALIASTLICAFAGSFFAESGAQGDENTCEAVNANE